ncbi:hypothetical protein TFLX_02609 [Thermoflexales bacterium]|nr:hypothetical protein TFLX_02609 [Thermoflexales bacterium]
MTLRLAQISAMTYYEMRMLWRRRMPPVLVLSLIMTAGLALIAWRVLAKTDLPNEMLSNVLLVRLSNNVIIGYTFWPLAYILLLIMGGLLVADVVPRDGQLGVGVVIDSTPLARITYLSGKLCGAWAALLMGLTAAMVVIGLLGWLIVGPYDIGVYAWMWIGGLVPLGLLHVGLCLLLTVPLPTRRKAIMLSLVYGVICVLLLQGGSSISAATAWGLLNPARPYALYYYWLGWLGELSLFDTAIGYVEAQWSIVIGVLEFSMVGLFVWAWLRWREGRV